MLLYLEIRTKIEESSSSRASELLMDVRFAAALQDISLQLIIQRLAILSSFSFFFYSPLSPLPASVHPPPLHLFLSSRPLCLILSLPPRFSQVGFKLVTLWSPSCFECKYSHFFYVSSSFSPLTFLLLFLFSFSSLSHKSPSFVIFCSHLFVGNLFISASLCESLSLSLLRALDLFSTPNSFHFFKNSYNMHWETCKTSNFSACFVGFPLQFFSASCFSN